MLNDVDKILGRKKRPGAIVAVGHLEKDCPQRAVRSRAKKRKGLGHLVLVDDFDGELLRIRDPQDGTIYKVALAGFLKVWNGEIVFKWNLSK